MLQGSAHPAKALLVVSADPPEGPEGERDRCDVLKLSVFQEQLKREAQIVVFKLELIEPTCLIRSPQLGTDRQGDLAVPGGMSDAGLTVIADGFEPFGRISADRLQQIEPGLTALFLADDQAVIEQRRVQLECGRLIYIGHRGRGFQRPSAPEHRQLPEHGLLVPAEQVIAPGERVLQRLLPLWQIASAAGENGQGTVEPGQQRRRRQEISSRRCQLDGQGEAVQTLADSCHDVWIARRTGRGDLRRALTK